MEQKEPIVNGATEFQVEGTAKHANISEKESFYQNILAGVDLHRGL